MQTMTWQRPASSTRLYTGRTLSALAVLFLTFDAGAKLLRVPAVVKGSAELGFAPATIVPIGVVLLTCVILYAIPATSILGAVLLTGYLGGAIATHLRMDHPQFSHTFFPLYVAAFIWGGLYLRDPRVRSLLAASRE